MDVDDGEIYEFDDLIDNRIKLNDAKDRVRAETEVLGVSFQANVTVVFVSTA